MEQDVIFCENCGCSFHYDGLQNNCNDCYDLQKESQRVTSNCQNCKASFYWEMGMVDICDDCLKHEEEEKNEEYLIDFTNFIPEEQYETLRLLLDNNGSAGSPCDYIFRFKDKEFFLNEWEFEAMCELIKRKNDADNLSEDDISQ